MRKEIDLNTVFSKQYHIDVINTDFEARLKPSYLFAFMQDAASMAAERLGFGHDRLIAEHGVVWVLTKVSAQIFDMPRAGDDITIETWHQTPGKITFDRDFLVLDASGRRIAAAASVWVLIDINSREPVRANVINFDSPVTRTERALDSRLGKIKAADAPEDSYTRQIGYSDIDLNGHVNNARYVDFALDCFPLERFEGASLSAVEINYISEMKSGDTLTLRKSEDAQGAAVVEGYSAWLDKIAFRAAVTFFSPSKKCQQALL